MDRGILFRLELYQARLAKGEPSHTTKSLQQEAATRRQTLPRPAHSKFLT